MGFFNGRATFSRYSINGNDPLPFGPEHLAKLDEHAAGKQRMASADGIEVGWLAGDSILDTHFELSKNVVNDVLFFALRIDTQALPAELLRAYYHADLKALSAGNPTGRPSARQKREAKETARERLEHEAKDGRYRKRKSIEVMWDGKTNELYFGTNSVTNIDRLATLFKQTFGLTFEAITSGRNVEEAPNSLSADVAWIVDESSRDYLGNEFLLWLWYQTECKADTFPLADGSEATLMLARSITLDCPRGQTGNEKINHEGPTRLPEVRRAIQSGKLPRKTGLTIVRQGAQYELTLTAETLSVGSARLPAAEETEDRAKMNERADQIRGLIETLDLLYGVFIDVRLSNTWAAEVGEMQNWLSVN